MWFWYHICPWLLSVSGAIGIWRAGNKYWDGWAVGLASEVLWIIYSVATKQWGFIIGSLVWGGIFARNIILWRVE